VELEKNSQDQTKPLVVGGEKEKLVTECFKLPEGLKQQFVKETRRRAQNKSQILRLSIIDYLNSSPNSPKYMLSSGVVED